MEASLARRWAARLKNRLWLALEPAPDVHDEIARGRASQLALLTLIGAAAQALVVLLLALTGRGADSLAGLLALSGALALAAYGLSRTRFYAAGVWLAVIGLLGVVYIWALDDPADTVRFQIMILPIIVAGWLLPLRAAASLSVAAAALLLALLLLLAPGQADRRALNLAFVFGVSAVSYAGALAQRRMEARLLSHSAELALSERKLRGVLDHSQDGVLLVDEDGIVVEWNAGVERITNRGYAQTIGRPIWEGMAQIQGVRSDGSWPGAERVRDEFHDLIGTGTGRWHMRLLNNTIRTPDGTERMIQSRLFPIPVGERFMVGGIVRDITEQMHAQIEVAQTAALLRATLESTAEAILVIDKDRQVLVHNPQLRRLWNLPAEMSALAWSEHLERVMAQVQDREAFQASSAELFADLSIERTDLIALRDGRTVERHATAYRVGGQNVGRVYTYLDVTQRLSAEQALRQSEIRFAMAFQVSPDAIAINRLDDGAYLDVNEGFVKLSGYTVAEIAGRTVEGLEIWADYAECLDMVKGLRERGEVRDLEAVFLTKTGQRRIGLVSARLMELDGMSCVLSITRDITERKQLEAHQLELTLERERVAILQQFISDASHDLMTPITVLSTGVYLLGRYATDGRQREHVARLKIQIDRLTRMIKDMLTMSRLDKPVADEFDFERVDLDALLRRIISDHRGLAEGKQQRLVYTAENPVPPLLADVDKLEQAVINLLENAIKYTPPGGLINVAAGVCDSSVFLRVSDTGPGIDPRDLPHIFERFYRGKSYRPSEGGTGLGLSIVQKIVKAHEGRIEVESALQQGTTITLWLSLK